MMIFFLVDIETRIVEEVNPRVALLEPLEYEINIDQATKAIEALLMNE